MAHDGDEDKPDKMQQGAAWSESTVHDFVCRASAPPPPFTLTVTGSEEEIRQYLDAPRLASGIELLDELLRRKIKYGHGFKTANEAMQFVRDELVAVVE